MADWGLYTFKLTPPPKGWGIDAPRGPTFEVVIHGRHGDKNGNWTADPHALAYLGQAGGSWFSTEGRGQMYGEDRTGFFLVSHHMNFIDNLGFSEDPRTLGTLFGMKGWNLRIGQTGDATISSALHKGQATWTLVANKKRPDTQYPKRPR